MLAGAEDTMSVITDRVEAVVRAPRLLPARPATPSNTSVEIDVRTRRCVECGLVEGRRHRCPAHPRPPGMGALAVLFLILPIPLVFVVGVYALAFFTPWFVFIWWAKNV
jgi:hypothetical protein